ncbi:thermonuclease family protein [Psittacicella gerlachiana]|uniref:TNase-like domain-containing protein n=1 Tax=Psittacicella gerlachiana TaxID=2028574 RepID=A0A3A1YL60_9GAMM|nr:thermonuclease family protein [Psittacicella gerlachiana]RIY38892.1 hypothetical protein CKF59_00085 [Psittacicella gerlachiana]
MTFLSVKKLVYLASIGFILSFIPQVSAALITNSIDYSAFSDRGGPDKGHGFDGGNGTPSSNPMAGRVGGSNPAARGAERKSRTSIYARNAAFNRGTGFNNFALYNNSSVFSLTSVVLGFTHATSNPSSYRVARNVSLTTANNSNLEDLSLIHDVAAQDNFNSFVAQNQLPSCLVVEVFSGDTISCYFPHLDQTRIVKLYGVDAVNGGYAYNAYNTLSGALLNKRIVVQTLTSYSEPSIVAIAYWQGLNVNYRLVQIGAAKVNAEFAGANGIYNAFLTAQHEAQVAGVGLWRN